MKGSKLLMSLVVVLILSFTITTVGAQSQVPRVGEVDEDGDLIIGVFPAVDASGEENLSAMDNHADFPKINTTAEGVTIDATPIRPYLQNIYTKYPTFVFSEDFGALKYKIMVTNVLTDPIEEVYTFKGNPDCNIFDECELTPTTALKPTVYGKNQGFYKWQVKTKNTTGWEEDWSVASFFGVLKNGFNSTFTTLDTKWLPMYGTWTVTSTGLAKTNGELGAWSSFMEKHFASSDYVYEVMMKRKTAADTVDFFSPNRIYFLGTMEAGNPSDLYNGYAFAYTNNGYYSLYRLDSGVPIELIPWTSSPYIIPEGWNKLTVMTDHDYIDLWINEHFLGYYTITNDPIKYYSGYVGVEMIEYSVEKSPLLVDYAWLEYLAAAPYPWPWSISSDGQRDPAYQMVPSEVTLGDDLTEIP